MKQKASTKTLSWLLSLALMLSLIPGLSVPAQAADSGTCGDNLSWTLNGSTLTISGSGAMANYEEPSGEPWCNDRYGIYTVVIESGVTSIGNGAFDNCTNLASVTIPDSVTSIGEGAFSNCTNLATVNIPTGVTTINNYTFCGTKLTSVTIPSTVTSIGSYAFNGCSELTNVEIPNSVTSIGGSAFADCGKLTSIEIPNGVTNIGDYTFQYCTKLSSVTIPDSVTSIGKQAFQQCTTLSGIRIPSSVTSIGQQAFNSCTGLSTVTFACATTNQTLTVGTDAFKNDTATAVYDGSTTVLYDGDTAIESGASLISLAGKTLTWKALPPHIHDGITFTAWTSADSLPTTAGNYYLTKDVTISSTWNVPTGETNLCLGGHKITLITNADYAVNVGQGATLNLYDDEEESGAIVLDSGLELDSSYVGVYLLLR